MQATAIQEQAALGASGYPGNSLAEEVTQQLRPKRLGWTKGGRRSWVRETRLQRPRCKERGEFGKLRRFGHWRVEETRRNQGGEWGDSRLGKQGTDVRGCR